MSCYRNGIVMSSKIHECVVLSNPTVLVLSKLDFTFESQYDSENMMLQHLQNKIIKIAPTIIFV